MGVRRSGIRSRNESSASTPTCNRDDLPIDEKSRRTAARATVKFVHGELRIVTVIPLPSLCPAGFDLTHNILRNSYTGNATSVSETYPTLTTIKSIFAVILLFAVSITTKPKHTTAACDNFDNGWSLKVYDSGNFRARSPSSALSVKCGSSAANQLKSQLYT